MIASHTYPHEPGFKVEGTSADAAVAVREDAQALRELCLELVQCEDLTADEAADRLHRSILSIRPRFSELVVRRLIRDSGGRRRNISGKNAVVWTAKPDPRLAAMPTIQPNLI